MWAERNGWSDHGGSCRPLGSQIRVQIRKSVKYNLYSPMEICSQLLYWECCYCSVTKSMSNSLQPHGLQHSRFPCPSLSPRVYSNSYPFNRWGSIKIRKSVQWLGNVRLFLGRWYWYYSHILGIVWRWRQQNLLRD